MATGDIPSISGSTYGNSTSNFALNNLHQGFGGRSSLDEDESTFALARKLAVRGNFFQNAQQQSEPIEEPTHMPKRLVQVFIADPNENVPMDQSLIYSGEQKLTDATNQELFFEVDIKTLLEKHNVKRVTYVDKKVKERTEYLEPAKIRDLKMVVVDIATF